MLALTTSEVAAFTGLDEKSIRKDVEQGIVDAGTPPRFAEGAVVYFRARAMCELHPEAADRRVIHDAITTALAHHLTHVDFGRAWRLDLAEVTRDVRDRIARFEAWKTTVRQSSDVMGGEPTFPNSRLTVRHIGLLILRGATPEVREDYPYLTDDDIEFAPLFATAYPRTGRPRAQVAHR